MAPTQSHACPSGSCARKFSRHADAERHQRNVHGHRSDDAKPRCIVCDKTFSTPEGLKTHKGTAAHKSMAGDQESNPDTGRKLKCRHCPMTFPDYTPRFAHESQAHRDKARVQKGSDLARLTDGRVRKTGPSSGHAGARAARSQQRRDDAVADSFQTSQPASSPAGPSQHAGHQTIPAEQGMGQATHLEHQMGSQPAPDHAGSEAYYGHQMTGTEQGTSEANRLPNQMAQPPLCRADSPFTRRLRMHLHLMNSFPAAPFAADQTAAGPADLSDLTNDQINGQGFAFESDYGNSFSDQTTEPAQLDTTAVDPQQGQTIDPRLLSPPPPVSGPEDQTTSLLSSASADLAMPAMGEAPSDFGVEDWFNVNEFMNS